MQYWQYIFFSSIFLVFYNYAGYALVAILLNAVKKCKPASSEGSGSGTAPLPNVSFIVAAYNEEAFIRTKIDNSLSQDYPSGKVEFIFITDGSTDRTPDIIREYPRIRLLHSPERRGKSSALNRAVLEARYDILIFSDANTILNREATRMIAGHYDAPDTGGVAGEKKVSGGNDPGQGEGLYWKYESFLKKIDSSFYSVVGAAGELFSIRKDLYEVLPENTILDDFVLSLRTAAKGFRIIYEPGAYAMETPSFDIREEQKRKIRIAAGGFQAIGMLGSLLAFWKQPRLSFLYISHRVLRWTLSPLCLVLALASNLVLVFGTGSMRYILLLAAQLAFYGLAAIAGFILPHSPSKLLKLPYYFTFMNVSVILGFFRFIRGGQSVLWEKAKRAEPGVTKPVQ